MSLSRLCAGTLLVSSVILICLFVLMEVTGANQPGSALSTPFESLQAIAGIAALLGLPALLIDHPRRGRVPTLIGYVLVFIIAAYTLVFIALTMGLVLPWVAAYGVDVAQGPAVIGAIFFVLGPLQVLATALLGAGALRAGRRAAGWVLVVGAAVNVVALAPLPGFVGTIATVLLFAGIAMLAAHQLAPRLVRAGEMAAVAEA